MHTQVNEAEIVLQKARDFMKTTKSASWTDYNRFKQELIELGCYGYEHELADILNI